MKKALIAMVALMALSALALAEVKLGIINSPLVLQNSIKGKEVISKLNALAQVNQKKYDELQKGINALEKELLNPALNTETRDRKTLDLQNKRTEQKRFAEDAQNDLTTERDKGFENIQKDVMPIIAKISQEMGLTLVLDLTNAGIAYFEPSIDITDKVIKAFDAKYPAPPQPAAQPKK